MKDTSVNVAASTLAAKPAVVERLAELKERVVAVVVKRAAYTMDDAMREADEARLLAHGVGQAGAAVAAVGLKAKMAGHLVERREVRIGLLEDTDIDALMQMRTHLIDARAIDDEVEDAELIEDMGNRPLIR